MGNSWTWSWGLYYTKGLQALASISDMNGYFKVNPMGPIEGIGELFNNISRLPGFIFKSFFSRRPFIPIVIAIFMAPKKGYLFIVSLIAVQILTIFAIDGKHGFVHEYYFIGCAFLLSFLIISIMENAHFKANLAIIFLMFVFTLERGIYRLKPIWKNNNRQKVMRLLNENPELESESVIRTTISNPPEVGLLLGKFQGDSKLARFFLKRAGEKCKSKIVKEDFFICDNQVD